MTTRLARMITCSVLAAAVSTAWAADTPAEATLRFDISHFDVSGNTLLPQADIHAALARFTGAQRDFGDVQQALEAIEALYHAQGYKLVKVELPEQELKAGVIKLKVVQTRIGRVNVRGNKFFDEANIRRSLPTLRSGESPNLDRVSESLKMANESPAKKVSMKLQSAENGDDVDANLDVTDEKAWKAMLNLDNAGNETSGKTHAGVVLQHANLWGLDHLASVQYTTTVEEPDKVSVYGLGYHIPLYALGDSIDLYASYSNVDSGVVSAGAFKLNVSGKGAVYGARYNQRLARRAGFDQQLVYGVDIKAYKNNVLFGGLDFGNDVTVRPLSLTWQAELPLADAQANLSFGVVQNIAGGSRGSSADFTLARANARASYRLLRFAGAYTRMLASQWQLRTLLNGQLSSDALVPGEQFGAGGAMSVRGFEERVLSADSGMVANLELYSPGLCGANGNWSCRALAFIDMAHGSRNKILPGELKSTSISSVGLGMRVAMGSSVNMQVDWGHVVKSGALSVSDKNKIHVRLGFAY
jgi:hemolysin activation/secretion protein